MHSDSRKSKPLILTDSIRALHYIISDGWTFDKLKGKKYREHRHELRDFMETLAIDENKLSASEPKILLNLNAQLQPWYYQKLESGIDVTTSEIEKYRQRKQS